MVMTDEIKLKRKIKRILKPVLSVGRGYSKCELCGEETSWTVNNHFVCPRCHEKYGFVKKGVIPDACEVCGKQGEWLCGENDEHSFCHRHRDAWFRFTKFELGGLDTKDPRFNEAWDKCFNRFIQEAKGS